MAKSFGDRIMAIDRSATRYIKKFMADKDEYKIVEFDEDDDDCDWIDDTVGLAFHNKHGFEDYAHVTRIYKDSEYALEGPELYIEGKAYEDGRTISMPMAWLEAGDVGFLADCIKINGKKL